jgi:hypothetical protein
MFGLKKKAKTQEATTHEAKLEIPENAMYE